MNTQSKLRIAVAETNTLVRKGVSSLLQENAFDVCIQSANSLELIKCLENTVISPSICLLDINIPQADGYETLQILTERWPQLNVLVFATHFSEPVLLKILSCGAKGYILKNAEIPEIYKAINDIHAYGVYYSQWEIESAKKSIRKSDFRKYLLSENEIIFLKFCCTELTYKEIASKMKITLRKADNYRNELFIKLSIKSRVGLVLYAINSGLVNTFSQA